MVQLDVELYIPTTFVPNLASCSFFVNKFLLEYSHAIHLALLMAAFMLKGQSSVVTTETYSPGSLNYLLYTALQESFAAPGLSYYLGIVTNGQKHPNSQCFHSFLLKHSCDFTVITYISYIYIHVYFATCMKSPSRTDLSLCTSYLT